MLNSVIRRERGTSPGLSAGFQKPIIVLLFLVLGTLSALSCARFRIEELEPALISSLPILPAGKENPEQSIQGMVKGRLTYNYPIQPVTDGSVLYVADPGRKLVRVFNAGSGELVKLIAPVNIRIPEDVKHIKIRNAIPGWIAPDSEGGVYIQFHPEAETPQNIPPKKKEEETPVPAEERLPGVFNAQDRVITPSYILYINDENQPVFTIGATEKGETPFGLIYRIDAGPDGLLYVSHQLSDRKVLSVYRRGTLELTYDEIAIGSEEEQKKYHVEREMFAPTMDGKFILLSVIFRNKNSFRPVYRKIYRLQKPADPPQEIYNTDDPADFFAWSRPDGGFLLMHTEDDGAGILFKIFNHEGEYLSNRLVRFPGMRSTWRRIYITLNGAIYSSRIYRGHLELYEWK